MQHQNKKSYFQGTAVQTTSSCYDFPSFYQGT